MTTDNTSYAPVMTHPFYGNGGTFYWRVAGRDKGLNLGDWSQAHRIDVAQRLKVAVNRPVIAQALEPDHRDGLRPGEQARPRALSSASPVPA